MIKMPALSGGIRFSFILPSTASSSVFLGEVTISFSFSFLINFHFRKFDSFFLFSPFFFLLGGIELGFYQNRIAAGGTIFLDLSQTYLLIIVFF